MVFVLLERTDIWVLTSPTSTDPMLDTLEIMLDRL